MKSKKRIGSIHVFMKKIIFPTVIIASLFLISCGENNKDKNNTADNSEPICFYEYTKTSSATVSWTAFKTTEKRKSTFEISK